MAYLTLLWKARTIEKYRLNYEKEKLNSIRITNTQYPRQSLYQKLCIYNSDTRKRLSEAFLRRYPKGSTVNNFLFYFRSDPTLPNLVLKSVIGFVGGIILTYLCFMFFVFQLSLSLIHATIMSSIIGVLLTIGLSFSYRIRCLVFLLFPQFFSRVGRYTLTCYALVLILTGPATNTLKNSEVLSESLACSQEQIKTDVHVINESMKKPLNSLKDSILLMIDSLQQLARKLKFLTLRIHRLALSLAHSLQASYAWLAYSVDSCNKKLGDPYLRCMDAITNSIVDCQAAFGPRFSYFCNAVKVTQAACWPLFPLKSFCHAIEFANGNILGVVTKKLKIFSHRINTMLYVEIHIHHSYTFSSNSSKSAGQVAAGIVTEIRKRADPFLTWISWSSCITSLSLLLIIFRAKYYQHMFETRSRFDNRYVTKELRDLDLKRLKQGKETVLPLNRREEGKYIKTTSFRLVSSEKVHLSRSAVTMAITTFKLMIHMVADYSLYWVLMTIRHHGRFQTNLPPGSPNEGIHVAGTGLLSKILKSLIGSISLPLKMKQPSPTTCLPNPHPPDLQRYSQIGVLIFLLWFFAMFEPYGLRLRHVIMGLYRPERAKARAVWLYNHLQKTRGGFMKFARRKLHREYKYLSEEKHTFQQWLNSHIPHDLKKLRVIVRCRWLKDILGVNADDPHCFLCGIIENCNECDGTLTRCKTPRCPGTYCVKCFSDIGQLCTICLKPADYGDLSDVSLEIGSSEESDSNDSEDLPSTSPFLRNTAINIIEEDTNNSYTENNKKGCWTFFSRINDDSQNDSHVPNDKKERVRDHKLLYIKNSNKVLRVGHKKCANLYLQNTERKGVISLGQDTRYSIYTNYYKNYHFYTNYVTYVVNSQFKQFISKNVGRESKTKENSLAIKINTYERTIRYTRKNITCTESNKSITKLLEQFRGLRKYSLNPNSQCKHLFLQMSPSSLKNKRSSVPKRRKEKARTVFDKNKASSSKPVLGINKAINTFKANSYHFFGYPMKYRTRTRNSKRLNRLKKKICQLIFGLRYRRLGCKVSYKNGSRSNMRTDVSKDEIKRKGCDMLKSTHNLITSSDGIDIMATNKAGKGNKPLHGKDKVKKAEKITTKHVETEKLYYGGKLLKFYSDYWKKSTIFAPLIKIINFFKKDEQSNEYEKTNHKRRKKRKESNKNKLESRKSKKDNEATRQYRISSFLLEQDWSKRKCNKEKFTQNFITLNETTKDTGKVGTETVNVFLETEFKNYEKYDKNIRTAIVEEHETTVPRLLLQKEIQTSTREIDPVKFYRESETEKNSKQVFTETEKLIKKKKRKCFRNPFAVLFYCCCKKSKAKKADAVVAASPILRNSSCQYLLEKPVKDHTTQIYYMKEVAQSISHNLVRDVAADASNKTCSCASQCIKSCKNACTSHKLKQPMQKTDTEETDTQQANKAETTQNNTGMVQHDCREFPDPTSSESAFSFDSLHSLSSIRKDDSTRTDTTVYSVDYVEAKKKKNHYKVTVKTKSNRSTETDRKKLCDVSTVTSDWWSPILERKDKSLSLAKKDKSPQIVEEKSPREKKFKSIGITTEGKVVTFKSYTQIIPSRQFRYLDSDIMSPSRYLLESQKYYNELFSTRIYAPSVLSLSVNSIQRDESSKYNANRKRKKNKTKRLEECYLPKKVATRRDRNYKQMWTAGSNKEQTRSSSIYNKKHRSISKLNWMKSKRAHRHYYGKPVLVVKRGQVNLITRCYVSNEDMSLE